MSDFAALLRQNLKTNKLEFLGDDFIEKMQIFKDNLVFFGNTHNLTSSLEINKIVWNIIDSLLPLKFIEMPKMVLDVGSGCGFPAFILSCALNESEFLLCESRTKRANFLKIIANKICKNVRVISDRVENIAPQNVDLIISRACAKYELLARLCKSHITSGTRFLLYLGDDKSLGFEQKFIFNGLDHRKYLYLLEA